jgi:hypothetical protein
MFMNEPRNDERKLLSIIGMIAWRWGTGIAVLVAAYGAMWVKANAPSRAQFDLLTGQVQEIRENVIRFGDYKNRIDDFELRLRELERGKPTSRRSPKDEP